MAWKPYQDAENRGYMHILTTLFPEQTKTLPRIIVWSVIFLIQLTLVVAGATYLGLLSSWPGQIATFAVLFGGFWLEGFIFYKIRNLFRT